MNNMLAVHKGSTEQGVALIEFLLIFPLIAVLAIGSLGLANALRHMQAATALSKAAARLAQRSCLDRLDIDVCLQEAAQIVHAQIAGDDYPETEARISLYRLLPPATATTFIESQGALILGGATNEKFVTITELQRANKPYLQLRHPDGDIQEIGKLDALGGEPRHLIIVAEVYVPLQDHFISLLSFFSIRHEGYYDSTII